MDKTYIEGKLKVLQDEICLGLEKLDGTVKFKEEKWERDGGGGGRTRIIQGDLIEKGGVNFSAVHGDLNPDIKKALKVDDDQFFATGVSIVLHPKNPFVPIIHMNVRYFETSENNWWFGGGIDLTPHYVIEEDARFLHQELKKACDKADPSFYPEFKKWADDYFYIKHRNETRGVGGIFYDKLKEPRVSKSQGIDFMLDVGNSFLPIYSTIANRRRDTPYNDQHKEWQYLRRGRYVEFNLVWDRGTKFGLVSNGRTESILMSLPAMAKWEYNHIPTPESDEGKTLSKLKKEINWLT